MADHTGFNINANITGARDFGLPFCEDTYTARLAVTTDTTFTVPGFTSMGIPSRGTDSRNSFIAVFSYAKATTKDVWVAVNATAAAPGGASFAASTSELNPPAKYVFAGDVIHMFAVAADTDVSIALYTLNE